MERTLCIRHWILLIEIDHQCTVNRICTRYLRTLIIKIIETIIKSVFRLFFTFLFFILWPIITIIRKRLVWFWFRRTFITCTWWWWRLFMLFRSTFFATFFPFSFLLFVFIFLFILVALTLTSIFWSYCCWNIWSFLAFCSRCWLYYSFRIKNSFFIRFFGWYILRQCITSI